MLLLYNRGVGPYTLQNSREGVPVTPEIMMVNVTRLPGDGCRHHENGRCLYEEHLNPGYDSRLRCCVLSRWETAFDDFLVRAELFGVEQQAVPDLWGRQFRRVARKAFRCEEYEYHADADGPACIHVSGGLCRLCLPLCEGRCRHYGIEESEEQA